MFSEVYIAGLRSEPGGQVHLSVSDTSLICIRQPLDPFLASCKSWVNSDMWRQHSSVGGVCVLRYTHRAKEGWKVGPSIFPVNQSEG